MKGKGGKNAQVGSKGPPNLFQNGLIRVLLRAVDCFGPYLPNDNSFRAPKVVI